MNERFNHIILTFDFKSHYLEDELKLEKTIDDIRQINYLYSDDVIMLKMRLFGVYKIENFYDISNQYNYSLLDVAKFYIKVLSLLSKDPEMFSNYEEVSKEMILIAKAILYIDSESTFIDCFYDNIDDIFVPADDNYGYLNLLSDIICMFLKRADELFMIKSKIEQALAYYSKLVLMTKSVIDWRIGSELFMRIRIIGDYIEGFNHDPRVLKCNVENNQTNQISDSFFIYFKCLGMDSDPVDIWRYGCNCIEVIYLIFSDMEESKNFQMVLVRYMAFIHLYITQSIIKSALLYFGSLDESLYKNYHKEICDLILSNIREENSIFVKFANQSKSGYSTVNGLIWLSKAMSVSEKIENELLVKDYFPTICYYSTLSSFYKMLPVSGDISDSNESKAQKPGYLPCMNIAYMNDPNEGKTILQFLGKGINDNSARFPNTYIKCFSTMKDYLPMWGMYGDNGKGCCLVIDWGRETKKNKRVLYRVCYINPKDKVNMATKEYNDKGIDTDSINAYLVKLKGLANDIRKYKNGFYFFLEIISRIRFLFKESSYSYENEYRILYSTDKDKKTIHYTNVEQIDLVKGIAPKLYVYSEFPVCIKKVLLGPKLKNVTEIIPFLQEKVDKLSDMYSMDKPEICYSSIEYR